MERLSVAVVVDGQRSIRRMFLLAAAAAGFHHELLAGGRGVVVVLVPHAPPAIFIVVIFVFRLDLLAYPLEHEVAGDGVVEPLGKLAAVPDEELLVGQDGFGGVEINVGLVLAGDEVLRLGRVGRIDVAHPVGLGRVVAVNVVKHLAVVVHLKRKEENKK